MDTLGAAIGPSLALVFLMFFPGQYKPLFYLAFFPGIFAIALTFFPEGEKQAGDRNGVSRADNDIAAIESGKEPGTGQDERGRKKTGLLSYLKYWKLSALSFRYLVAGLLLFAIFNSSDVFLLLTLKDKTHLRHMDDRILYILQPGNMLPCLSRLGRWPIRLVLKTMLISGLFLFCRGLFCFGFAASFPGLSSCSSFTGSMQPVRKGISKALISNLAGKSDTAKPPIGFYNKLRQPVHFTFKQHRWADMVYLRDENHVQ